MRVYDVLVEEEVQGWVTIAAEDKADLNQKILAADLTVPRQRVRRWAPLVLPRDPVTRYGRVLVTKATRLFGSPEQYLLDLDCGHQAYIDADLWFPKNPYYECGNCARRASHK